MQKQLHHSAGLQCLSHLPLSSEEQHHTGTCCSTHYEKQTRPSRGQHPSCQHHPAPLPCCGSYRLSSLEPSWSDEGISKHIKRGKHFEHWERRTEFLFSLETIPWPRQWCPSVNIRENLPVSLDSGMVCYLVYRMFSATHEKDGFLPNPQGVVCGSSGFMMFSGRD